MALNTPFFLKLKAALAVLSPSSGEDQSAVVGAIHRARDFLLLIHPNLQRERTYRFLSSVIFPLREPRAGILLNWFRACLCALVSV